VSRARGPAANTRTHWGNPASPHAAHHNTENRFARVQPDRSASLFGFRRWHSSPSNLSCSHYVTCSAGIPTRGTGKEHESLQSHPVRSFRGIHAASTDKHASSFLTSTYPPQTLRSEHRLRLSRRRFSEMPDRKAKLPTRLQQLGIGLEAVQQGHFGTYVSENLSLCTFYGSLCKKSA